MLKQLYFIIDLQITNFYSTVDGCDEGGELELEDDFEQILADNIDGATQRRFASIPFCSVCRPSQFSAFSLISKCWLVDLCALTGLISDFSRGKNVM